MKKISYAIQVGDKFVEFFWDARMEWESLYKEELNEQTVSDILFEDYKSASERMEELIKDLLEFAKLDDITIDDIPNLKIVPIELSFSYKILETHKSN